jgi:phage shock protein E
MKRWLLNNKLIVIGVIIGGIAGYLYYYFVGCSSGTCAISSNPYNSTIYFSILGGLLMSIIKPEKSKEKEKKVE